MPTIRHSWQSLRAPTTLNRRQPGESHACWIQAPYAGHPCLYTRAPRSARCCCFHRDSGGPTWQAPKNRVVSMVQSYKKSPQRSSTRMIHVHSSAAIQDFISDVQLPRFLWASNWNVQKASKMMKAPMKWRLAFKPERYHTSRYRTQEAKKSSLSQGQFEEVGASDGIWMD